MVSSYFALLPFIFFRSLKALSVVPIQSGITVRGDMQGENLVNYYLLNVSGSTSTSRMTVLLHQLEGGRNSGLIMSVCYDKLPCGDLGCGCPARYVDPSPASADDRPASSPGRSSELRVDISPCDLMDGAWYISVELPTVNEAGEAWDRATAFYDLTASLEDARLVLGKVLLQITYT